MNLSRSILHLFASNTATKFIAFLGLIFFARNLPPDAIGSLFLFQAMLGVLSILTNFGISDGVTKRLSEGDPRGEVISSGILLKVGLLTIISLCILLLSDEINAYLGGPYHVLLLIALVLDEASGYCLAVLRGDLKVGQTALPILSRQLAYFSVGVLLIHVGLGVRGAIYGFLSGLCIMLLYGIFKSKITIGRPSIETAKSIFEYSKYSFITSAGGYVYEWVDIAIIGFLLGQSAVGVYEISWRVTAVVIILSQTISTTVFPQISQWDASEMLDEIESLIPTAISLSVLLVMPAFFGVAILAEEILSLVFTPEYTAGALVLVILTGEKVIQSIHLILGKTLKAIGHPDLAARSAIVAVTLNIILNFLLISQIGIVGAAIATLLSFLSNAILHAFYLNRYVDIQFPTWRIISITCCSIFMSGILIVVKKSLTIANLFTLSSLIGLGALCYFTALLLLPSSRQMVVTTARQL